MATAVRQVKARPQTKAQPATASRTCFAHPSEEEFGALLTFYGIAWLYEPTTFPLAWDKDGRVTQAFAPDFYLPDYDLYVELATRRQRLMRAKSHKIRRLRELYPHVNIKLVDRRAFADLLLKFGLDGRAEKLIGNVNAQDAHV
jgi:hypoxanthine phosphoribosyltransferase